MLPRTKLLQSVGQQALALAGLSLIAMTAGLISQMAQAADVTYSTPLTGTDGTAGSNGSPAAGAGNAGTQALAIPSGERATVDAVMAGGNGGSGGSGTGSNNVSGGGGGSGGAGVTAADNATVIFNQASTGGNGGNGGSATTSASNPAYGGAGGNGGSGATIANFATVTVNQTLTGGNGGNGGGANRSAGQGGNGGTGGSGLTIGSSAVVTINGTLIGGTGGNNGTGVAGNGTGGAGGSGLVVGASGTVTVNGSVTGGSGSPTGAGGVGIQGSDLTLTLSGTAIVTGGMSGDNATRANAISFTGGTNRLEFLAGATVTGNVVAAGTSTFALGGAANGSFDLSQIGSAAQYRGFGTLAKSGTGTWTVSNAPGATMAWQVEAGTLDLGGTTQSATGLTLKGGSLTNGTLSSSGSFALQAGTISAILAGSGGLAKTGTGDVTLTGTNSYTGATTVSAGKLIVNGSIASSSSLTVAAGATLGGSGTVGTTTISGGTLAPGNSIGTLSVAGNLAFTSGSTYAVEVSPTNADRVNVTGTATLGGAAVAASFASGSYVAKQYTILNAAGGISGTFGSKVDTDLPSGFKSSLGYDANNAYLNLALDFTPAASTPTQSATPAPAPAAPPPNSGLNPNQSNAANALTGYFNRTGSIPVVFGSLTPAGLSQVSGEPATATQQISDNAANLFLGTLSDPTAEGRGVSIVPGPAGFAAYSSSSGKASALPAKTMPLTADPDAWRWSVWASGFGGAQFLGADAGAGTAASTSHVYGGAAGADYRFSPSTVAGFALGGGATSFNTYGLGSGSSDLFQAGAFIRQHFGQSYLSAALGYSWQDVTTDRYITGSDHLQARFNANSWSGRLEAGHNFETRWLGLTPYAAVQLTSVALPAYAEAALSGSGVFALSYASKDVSTTRSELGLRADKSIALPGATLLLRGGLAWVHNFDTGSTATASFLALPGASFLVSGAAQDKNALRTTATAEYKLMNGFSLAATFEGEFAENSRSLGGKGVLRYNW